MSCQAKLVKTSTIWERLSVPKQRDVRPISRPLPARRQGCNAGITNTVRALEEIRRTKAREEARRQGLSQKQPPAQPTRQDGCKPNIDERIELITRRINAMLLQSK